MNVSLQTPTPDPAASAAWYASLGFTAAEDHGGRAVYTDGRLRVLIDPSRTARAAIVLHDARALIDALRPTTKLLEHEGRFLTLCPSGTLVWLDPAAPPTLPEDVQPGVLGTYQGFSLEALDLGDTVGFWTSLGFAQTAGGPDKGWVQLTNPTGDSVSVMGMHACPHLFRNPGPTYFNSGRNPAVIAAIRETGIAIQEEVTVFSPGRPAENVIVADPAGTGFFIFND